MGKKPLLPKLEGTKLENFEPVQSVAELQMIDVKEGDGNVCEKWATIRAHYTGALCLDGTIFQSSIDMGKPITFSLNQVIEGWQEGVPGMKEGGIRRILIPAAMAYGENSPSASIPNNADLVFDIELIKIV